MSNVEPAPQEIQCGAEGAEGPVHELLVGRDVVLGGTRGLTVTRTIPHRDRRMVGAWCFVDHYGPVSIAGGPGMRVGPHPHCGLQTVSWLVEGDVVHRDSVGSLARITPGELNLMTSGRGISHSEESPGDAPQRLHGVQLWVALPADQRDVAAHFEHHGDLPRRDGVTVFMGELDGLVSPAKAYTPLVGAEIALAPGSRRSFPLRPDFEYAVLALTGTALVDGLELAPGPLLYLGTGRTGLDLVAQPAARLLLIGGEPFAEELVMWWNFVARDHDEIVAARAAWADGDRFGTVTGYDGSSIPAPELPATRLKPRGRHR
ncbi:redox-sensitive bicupin YhaK (pirin superfamily) [Allocatelliglobosispora scoriae]|uniref:Redox-sensitive bicupin YhaK (Pirin superfamily) n=1 Tax=Allocatelliglobosispora scoriae TaxID=643052 RepID=A0A841C1Z8_9ACTN|nr:pirin family protein [Allocatelliglobosispora scoriae]MBB5873778.1 redox-sensitive bicupin YhaK (pirin superfamily) [Allocatelliglobosispora scoriae]